MVVVGFGTLLLDWASPRTQPATRHLTGHLMDERSLTGAYLTSGMWEVSLVCQLPITLPRRMIFVSRSPLVRSVAVLCCPWQFILVCAHCQLPHHGDGFIAFASGSSLSSLIVLIHSGSDTSVRLRVRQFEWPLPLALSSPSLRLHLLIHCTVRHLFCHVPFDAPTPLARLLSPL